MARGFTDHSVCVPSIERFDSLRIVGVVAGELPRSELLLDKTELF